MFLFKWIFLFIIFKFEIVEEVKSSPEATTLTPESKATPGTKLVSKRTPGRPKRAVSAKGKAVSVVNSERTANEKVLESPNEVEMEHQKIKGREKIEETGKSKLEEEVPCDRNIEEYVTKEDSLLVSGTDRKIVDLNVKEGRNDKLSGEDVQMEQDRYGSFDDEFEYGDRVDFGDHDDEVLADDDVDDPIEETEVLEEECKELTAIAKEHKIKKECEIFVGGLDRDAVEEDLRQVFEKIGEVVEVRLHKNPITNKNKGYAFVKFSNKEYAKRALLEMKNPVVSISYSICFVHSSTEFDFPVCRFVGNDVGRHLVKTMTHCFWEIFAIHGQKKL